MLPVTSALDERALRKVDALQVENPWMLEHARRSCAGTGVDIKFAPPGIDTTFFSPAGKSSSKTDRYILLVGRLDDPRKRAGLLLEAYALLPNVLQFAVRLQLAGSGLPGSEFWRRVEELGLSGRVSHVLRPSLTELVDLYRDADVFALPSDEEGLGLVVLEAMACGTPVVATRCGGPEGIIEDGIDGYLVPRDDAETMAQRLRSLLENSEAAQEFARRARAKIIAQYDVKATGDVFLEIWDRLLR
jgi:glycosyltransferase involved in cell wall biosynthesis